MKKNILINGVALVSSFSLGMLIMNVVTAKALKDYVEKNYKGTGMDKYKDNDIINEFYNRWKNSR